MVEQAGIVEVESEVKDAKAMSERRIWCFRSSFWVLGDTHDVG
jgi:hypothetical protein